MEMLIRLQRTAWHLRAGLLRLPHLHMSAFALLQRVAVSRNHYSEQQEEFLHLWYHRVFFLASFRYEKLTVNIGSARMCASWQVTSLSRRPPLTHPPLAALTGFTITAYAILYGMFTLS
jgi:hypothetical protein